VIDGQRVAVVVPAYDEAALIGRAIRGIPAFVDHVIVVDDASRDDTSDAARRAGDGRLVLVRHPENRGVGAAIGTGYREALARGADVAVVMAGDAQMDPRDLPAVLVPVVSGRADYAKGNRLAWPGAWRRMPLARFVANHVLSILTRLATGCRVWDSQCGFTAISRGALAALDLGAIYPRYGYPNDLLGRLASLGAIVEDAVVRPVYGEERSGISLVTALVRVPGVILRCAIRRVAAGRRSAVGIVRCASAS
jgi:glycosyltransferase involved in cell wall biosynthesis